MWSSETFFFLANAPNKNEVARHSIVIVENAEANDVDLIEAGA